MTLNDILQAIAVHIKTQITALQACETHGGRFDINELMRVSARSPGLFLSVVKIDDIKRQHGTWQAAVTIGAFTIARDTPGADRSVLGLALVQALAQVLPENTWAIDEAITTPQSINAQNLYSGGLDKKGVSLWGTTWRQTFELGEAVDVSTLDDFLKCNINYDPASDDEGRPGTEDNVSLQED